MFETRFGLTMKKKLKRDDTKRVRVYVDVALHDVPESPSHPHGAAHPPPRDDEPSPHPGFGDREF
jgi:putative DNA primase/helicase